MVIHIIRLKQWECTVGSNIFIYLWFSFVEILILIIDDSIPKECSAFKKASFVFATILHSHPFTYRLKYLKMQTFIFIQFIVIVIDFKLLNSAGGKIFQQQWEDTFISWVRSSPTYSCDVIRLILCRLPATGRLLLDKSAAILN